MTKLGFMTIFTKRRKQEPHNQNNSSEAHFVIKYIRKKNKWIIEKLINSEIMI